MPATTLASSARPSGAAATRAFTTSSSRLTSSSSEEVGGASSAARPALTTFSSEENELRAMVAAFARTAIQPKVAHMDEVGKMDPILLQQMFNQGLMGIETPLEYEGGGMTFVQACIVIEELAKVDPSLSVCCDVQNTLINTAILKYGSAELKKQWLPKLATDTLGSFCLSEAGSGSDAFALKTTATKVGEGEWSINGSKMWITNSGEAGLFLIFANAAPEKGYRGITCFVVPAGAKGLTVGKHENKLGIRASSTCELAFDDLRVTQAQMLGGFGEGYKIAIGALNEGRIGIGAQMLGLAQGAWDAAMPYVHQRKQFGQRIADFQMVQASMAECAMEIECARLMVYNAARLKESGQPFIHQAAMAKLKASLVAEKVASQAIEWMGGLGFIKDYPLEKFYRDAKIGSIYEGTTNLQKITIAKAISKEFN